MAWKYQDHARDGCRLNEDEMTDDTALSQTQEAPRDALDLLLARVRGMPDRRKLRAWLFPSAICIAFVAVMVCLGTTGHLETIWSVLAALALTVGPVIWFWVLAERREMRTIEALAACREIRAVGGLLDCVNCSNRRVGNAVQATLLDLLPRLTEEHSGSLETRHREVLNTLLYGRSRALALAALSALEQVGDGTALPYLTSIAAGKGMPRTLRDSQSDAQRRARHTVETIRQRIEMQNRANVLLRPSQDPGTPSGQLLRPAHGRASANAEELLRPEASAEQGPCHKEEMQ
jgi:hypothetical protein